MHEIWIEGPDSDYLQLNLLEQPTKIACFDTTDKDCSGIYFQYDSRTFCEVWDDKIEKADLELSWDFAEDWLIHTFDSKWKRIDEFYSIIIKLMCDHDEKSGTISKYKTMWIDPVNGKPTPPLLTTDWSYRCEPVVTIYSSAGCERPFH